MVYCNDCIQFGEHWGTCHKSPVRISYMDKSDVEYTSCKTINRNGNCNLFEKKKSEEKSIAIVIGIMFLTFSCILSCILIFLFK